MTKSGWIAFIKSWLLAWLKHFLLFLAFIFGMLALTIFIYGDWILFKTRFMESGPLWVMAMMASLWTGWASATYHHAMPEAVAKTLLVGVPITTVIIILAMFMILFISDQFSFTSIFPNASIFPFAISLGITSAFAICITYIVLGYRSGFPPEWRWGMH